MELRIKKKVVGYARVSTREQVEGFSLEYQKRKINVKAQSIEVEIYDEDMYVDEGVSAKDLNRPQMKKLIQSIESGEVETLIIYKFDRLTRSLSDLVSFIDLCTQNQVSLISICENFDLTSAVGRFYVYVIGLLAQFEREQISERTINGLMEKAMQGYYPHGNKVPFGYIKDNDDKLYINEDESKIIKEALRLYAYDNLSEFKVSDIIKAKYGKYFSPKNLKNFLSKPLHFGFVAVAGIKYKIIDPIFSNEDKRKLECRKVLKVYTKKKYLYENKVYINNVLTNHETTVKRTKEGNKKEYTYYVIRDLKRIGETLLTKQVLQDATYCISDYEMKSKYRLNKITDSLRSGKITRRHFDELLKKEEKKVESFVSNVKRIDVEVNDETGDVIQIKTLFN
ncbi:recombinase family protein [Mollicutes bacterium LVI A0039]|nr:recombinase family protein [Mollicutes bacterium LVI A0039]